MTSHEITMALAQRHWSYRNEIIVPRCHFAGQEADLLVLRTSGWLEEVEIKVSVADFRREWKTKTEKHLQMERGVPIWKMKSDGFDAANPNHESFGTHSFKDYSEGKPHVVRKFWIAAPADIAAKIEGEIPSHCGLLAVDLTNRVRPVRILKEAPRLKAARKLTDAEKMKLMRLAYLRFWPTGRAGSFDPIEEVR